MTSKDGSSIRRTRANQWKLQGESKPPSRGAGESLGGLVGGFWVLPRQVGCFDSVRFVVFLFRVFVGGDILGPNRLILFPAIRSN